MNVGFAMCGSFCTYAEVFPILEIVASIHTVTPILSDAARTLDSRFGTAASHLERLEAICGRAPLCTIPDVEPIGPKKLLDILVIAPCTGNTLAKLAHGIADTPVSMAAKSQLRNNRPVLIAVSTNDALAGAAENIGRLLVRRNYYFVPFGQDDPFKKPTSMVADFAKLPQALEYALEGKQLQPILSAPAVEIRTDCPPVRG